MTTAGLFVGCASSNTPAENRADLASAGEVFDRSSDGGTAAWSVLLRALTHPTLAARSDELLAQVRAAGVPEARLVLSNGSPTIVVGAFANPETPEARRTLERVREIRDASGRAAFPLARLHPPTDEMLRGGNPELDLRVQRHGVPDAAYTLQVSVYALEVAGWPGRDDLRRFRREAEREAAGRRAQGEDAYFVHGPSFSAVVIGIWAQDDYDPQGNPPRIAPELRAARESRGAMLVNGRPSPEGQQVTLVEIPR